MTERLIAGTAKIDISPQKGVELAGYPHYPRNNTGIHDPLYASCLYLNNGRVKMIFITLDLLFFSKKYYMHSVKSISLQTGIPEKNILISCTHTHSGPWASGRLDIESLEKGLQPDPLFISSLEEKIVSVATEAVKASFDALIGTGTGLCGKECGVGGNRRDPCGPSDPGVYVLGVKDTSNTLRACIINYALHPTFLHADNTLVSADYPGYIRKYVSGRYPSTDMLFMQGCSGDQSSRYFRKGQSFGEAERVGDAVASEACRVLEDIGYSSCIDLNVLSKEIDIKLRKFPDKRTAERSVEKAKDLYSALVEKGAPYIDIQNANVALLGAEDMLGYVLMLEKGARIELYEDEKPVEIKVVQISGCRIVTMPGEVFVEIGLKIRNKFKNRDIIVACNANGCLPGYVYTREAQKTGGYEIDTSMLSESMGEDMSQTVLSLLERMER